MEIMQIYLAQALTPCYMEEQMCPICWVDFQPAAVLARLDTEHAYQPVCPSCIEYLGQRNPQKYPTLEEYKEALKRYTGPAFASDQTEEEAEEDAWEEVYRATWISRDSLRDANT